MSVRSGPGLARMMVVAALAAAPFAARAAPLANSVAAPASTNTIGPRELRDFNLPGRVTQPAAPREQAPTPVTVPAPAPSTVAPARGSTPAPGAADRPRDRPATTAPPPATTAARAARANGDVTFPVTVAPVTSATVSDSAPPVPLDVAPAPLAGAPSASGFGWWPWLFALLAAIGAATWWWMRRQRAPAAAGLSTTLAPRQPAAPPPPPKTAPVPVTATAPRAPAALDGGIVSRRLQPKMKFEFTPLRIELDAEGNAGLIYDLIIFNAGGAPARDVLVEARMFNAGPEQDREIAAFFNAPQALGERVPLIAPQQRLPVRSRVLLFADRFAPLEVEGRKLLVPMVAFNALYRGPGGEAQNSASFLVGRLAQGAAEARMAPFRLDRGARVWSDLGVRPHSGGAG